MRMKIVYYYLSNIVKINIVFIYCDNLGFRDIINFFKYYRLLIYMSFYLNIIYFIFYIVSS